LLARAGAPARVVRRRANLFSDNSAGQRAWDDEEQPEDAKFDRKRSQTWRVRAIQCATQCINDMRALNLLCFLAVVAAVPAVAQTPAIRPLTPEPPASQTQQLEALVRERRFEQALEHADAILARNPRNAQVRFQRAVILSDLQRIDEATRAFESLTQDFPELPEPYNNLAVLHAAAGRYELARGLLQRSLEVQPSYVTAYENLGDLYVSMAADAYQRGLKLAPGSAPLQSKLTLARETGARLRSLP